MTQHIANQEIADNTTSGPKLRMDVDHSPVILQPQSAAFAGLP
jgi:hypothetical protein